MKLLIITGSNRERKVSYSMAMKIFLKVRRLDKNVNVEILELAKINLRGCCGNSKCTETRHVKCIYDDDFNNILKKMEKSDCVMFIVPKYAPYPSKFMQFYKRLVSIAWWGYKDKGKMEEFSLYQKPVGLVSFASAREASIDIFKPLFDSFQKIGFSLLQFNDKEHGMFINRTRDNEDQMLQKISEVVIKKLSNKK